MTVTAPDRHARRVIIPAMLLSMIWGVAACTPNKTNPRTDLAWPWWPTQMQISDLTRVGRPDADGIRPLEVRVLFTDVDGDPTKACGSLEIAVTREAENDEAVVERLSLDDRDTSMSYFEPVTGCYLVPMMLDLPGLVEGRRLRIEVVYEGRDGARLSERRGFDLPFSLAE
ncbi:hypothetical protein OAL71_03195 [Phycisphaerales bacterium]|nr:hypothetical protein [Phycisphaerales bacterium]RPG18617.1 MAG: hypothetical protein CBB69_006185 [Phycisphaera sp. TMED9]